MGRQLPAVAEYHSSFFLLNALLAGAADISGDHGVMNPLLNG